MSGAAKLLFGFCLACAAITAAAQRVVLDDSLSPIQNFAVEMSWPPGEIYRALNELLTGVSDTGPSLVGVVRNVEVRLDTSDFVGESARIYLSLPTLASGLGSPQELELRWEASGRFLPGAARLGQSALIFDGEIDQPVTSVVFDFVLTMENRGVENAFDLEPQYELELRP